MINWKYIKVTTDILLDPNLLHPVSDFFLPIVLHLMKLVRNVWKIGMRYFIQTVEYCLKVWTLVTIKPPAVWREKLEVKHLLSASVSPSMRYRQSRGHVEGMWRFNLFIATP